MGGRNAGRVFSRSVRSGIVHRLASRGTDECDFPGFAPEPVCPLGGAQQFSREADETYSALFALGPNIRSSEALCFLSRGTAKGQKHRPRRTTLAGSS